MSTLDWILVGFVALTALGGLGSGLVTTLLSLAGLVAGALVGASLSPGVLPGGIESDYTGAIGIGGALVGAALGCALARFVGSFVRGGLRLLPPLRLLDSIGGAVLGAVFGFTLIWAGGAVAMQVTDEAKVRREVKHSQVHPAAELDRAAEAVHRPRRRARSPRTRASRIPRRRQTASARAARARARGWLNGAHDVDARRTRPRASSSSSRAYSMPTSSACGPASRIASWSDSRDDDARELVVQPQREPVARQREDPEQQPGSATSRRAARRTRRAWSRSKTSCVIAKRAPASSFWWKRSSSSSRSSAVGLTATPGKNDVGASIGRPL